MIFLRVAVRLLTAAVIVASLDTFDILKSCGNHLTVSTMRVFNVEGTQILWHW